MADAFTHDVSYRHYIDRAKYLEHIIEQTHESKTVDIESSENIRQLNFSLGQSSKRSKSSSSPQRTSPGSMKGDVGLPNGATIVGSQVMSKLIALRKYLNEMATYSLGRLNVFKWHWRKVYNQLGESNSDGEENAKFIR
ncbi:putative glucan 1,3-beta-glucosidase A-like protein [Corchorus olitorius]|uniref:Glucan 1,3-beta-glucosidase A-like protein n=1 Tax=Corchorus olitorius TaxID=93759 RepID=A0A1R3KL27_9ROSI|nr:putative glucan 1,3-beta-glucosidase A-like protein [Corchorus olitorius]